MNKPTLKKASTLLAVLGLTLSVIVAIVYLKPQIPASIYTAYIAWSTYSKERTPSAYVVPSETLELEPQNGNTATHAKITVGALNILIPRDTPF